MHKSIKIILAIILISAGGILGAVYYLPVNRVKINSELIMLGDLNSDNKWNDQDIAELNHLLDNPFMKSNLLLHKIDLNKNGFLDDEDILFLRHICKNKNPYTAQDNAQSFLFPQPRELYQYLPTYEYIQQPLFSISHEIIQKSPFSFLSKIKKIEDSSYYSMKILDEIFSEAVRFTFAYEMREKDLTAIERNYAERKIQKCEDFFEEKEYYQLLLNLIGLVEDAETLSTRTQPEFIQKILYFRDHLRDLLVSDEYKAFKDGKLNYLKIFQIIELHLKSDLNISLELDKLSSPRDFTNLENYLDRAEWQVYKSKASNDDFKKLVLYAQYDRRYLRAVSRTSPRLEDIQLVNHNLPMVLLFREALRLTKSKKAAIGLLDESVRIPMGWVKSVPKKNAAKFNSPRKLFIARQ